MGCGDAPNQSNPKYYLPPKIYNNFKENSNFTFLFQNFCHRVFHLKKSFDEKNMTKNEKKALIALNIGPMKKFLKTDPKYF